ncbi:MAG: hypothetical protein CEN91_379 [Candidatus Berkelbacteria bacterium Licking1014_85]|uniref:Uncharacterized protein n=1 Tax=Candidatus Berkelbacteria bacterium Licking1014_85 TaxID=2017148 RepID=A0A554LIP0_9BACT|nr:MAG: hypothetical protein CEN91_379 [Candidatus Berkelbacteria bacterium Licking1014_85]
MAKVPKKISTFSKEYFKTVSTMLTTAFGLVAAFAWNEFIKRFISEFIAPGEGLKGMLIYAILITIIVVLITLWLGSVASRFDKEEEKNG